MDGELAKSGGSIGLPGLLVKRTADGIESAALRKQLQGANKKPRSGEGSGCWKTFVITASKRIEGKRAVVGQPI